MLKIISNYTHTAIRRQQFSRPLSVLKHGLSSVELEEELGSFPSVKLRGLPFSANLGDITEFLSGLHPLDIVVPKDNANGSVGVLFSSIDDAEAALQRDKDSIGSRYIDVIRIPRAEYYRMAIDAVTGGSMDGERVESNLQGADEGSVVKMTGLPFQATPTDVQKFFTGFDVPEEKIIIEARNDGKPSGNAYVLFSSAREAIQALQHDKKYMGRRYVNLQVTKTEFALNCDRVQQ